MDALTQNWLIRKPTVATKGGIVASQNGVAAAIGADILAAGGTAVDAVVATAFALAVREPWNSGLGGIGFMVVHPAGGGRAEVVDFGPVAPMGLDPALFPLTDETTTDLFTWARVVDDRNIHGPLSFMVPSAVRGYARAIERFGRLPWRDLVAPAVALAKEGLPVDWYVTLRVANFAADLRRYDESRRVYLPNDLPPVAPAIGAAPVLQLGRLPRRWRGSPSTGPRISILARSPRRSRPTPSPLAACWQPRIWRTAARASCRRSIFRIAATPSRRRVA
jgi:gamma-glutamyltranspeptidase/glutathione hydrolase